MQALLDSLINQWESLLLFLSFDARLLSEPGMVLRLVLQFLLLMCSAFFSGSETALFSLSRLDLQRLRRDRNPHSEVLHELLDQPRKLIISILSGNELVNIAATINMAGILLTLYGQERVGIIATFIMVPLLLLFGEVTPKTIAVSNPIRISSRLVAAPMSLWVRIVAPLRWAIRAVADRITTLIVGAEKAAENILQVDEFRSLVEAVAREGELNATERALIYNLLEAGDTEIVEIMTPRTRTQFINVEASIQEMVEQFKAFQHPRIPVYQTHRDNLVGFLHAEDILRLVVDKVDLEKVHHENIMRPPIVVPLTKKVDEMFDFFQNNNARAAAVLNEFGGLEGFITMKDVIMFIFGQISDEAGGQEHYREHDENIYEVPGDMKLTDFNNLTNFGIEDPRMTTIGGVAFRHLDCLPQKDDQVVVEGIVITVLEMDMHRIAGLRVSRGIALDEKPDEKELIDDEKDEPNNSIEQMDTKPLNNNSEKSCSTNKDELIDGVSQSEEEQNIPIGKAHKINIDTDISNTPVTEAKATNTNNLQSNQ